MNNRIKEIRERLEKATPGEPGNYMPELEPCLMAHISPSNEDFEFNISNEFTLEENDAELIANAPADLAFLLGEIERLQKDKEEGRQAFLVQLKLFGAEQDWREAAEEKVDRLTAQLKVAVEGLEFECGGRCAHQNPCNARETLAKIAEMEGK